jgi:hypothetical protein
VISPPAPPGVAAVPVFAAAYATSEPAPPGRVRAPEATATPAPPGAVRAPPPPEPDPVPPPDSPEPGPLRGPPTVGGVRTAVLDFGGATLSKKGPIDTGVARTAISDAVLRRRPDASKLMSTPVSG